MSAIKSGHVTYSRFAKMAELEEEAFERSKQAQQKYSPERSGGGL